MDVDSAMWVTIRNIEGLFTSKVRYIEGSLRQGLLFRSYVMSNIYNQRFALSKARSVEYEYGSLLCRIRFIARFSYFHG